MPSRSGQRLLTPRQLEVLELLAKGLTNREIGEALDISPGTAKVHVSAVIGALDVTNRTEAAALLQELGLGRDATAGAARIPGFGGRPAIAVLPFDNMSGEPDQDYFADGLVEDLTTRLATHRWFPVIARNSCATYRGQTIDVARVARELGARYLVEGSTRRDGRRVRINVQLIDGSSGEHIWAQMYDRELTDVFAVQDQIVESILTLLEPALYQLERVCAERRHPRDLNAWECVQRGMAISWRRTPEAIAEARGLFERAVELDPGFSQAHTCLAGCAIAEVTLGETPQPRLGQALAHAERAIELDDLDVTAHFARAGALALMGRRDAAGEACRHAVELDPSFARGYWGLGQSLRTPECVDEAIDLIQKAIRLSPRDPLLPEFSAHLASAYLLAGRYEEALAEAERARELRPEDAFSIGIAAGALAHLARDDEALAALDALRAVDPHHDPAAQRLFHPETVVACYAEGLRRAGFRR